MSAVSEIELTGVKPVLIPVFEFDERAAKKLASCIASEPARIITGAQMSMTDDELLLRNISERCGIAGIANLKTVKAA